MSQTFLRVIILLGILLMPKSPFKKKVPSTWRPVLVILLQKKNVHLRSQERLRIYQRFVAAGVLPSKVRQDLLAGGGNVQR